MLSLGRSLLASTPWRLRVVPLDGERLDAAADLLGAEALALKRAPPRHVSVATGGLHADVVVLGLPDEGGPALARWAARRLLDHLEPGGPVVLVASHTDPSLVPLLAGALGPRVAGPGLWVDARLLAERLAVRAGLCPGDVDVTLLGGHGRRSLPPGGVTVAGIPAGDLLAAGEVPRELFTLPRAPRSERLVSAWVVRAVRAVLGAVPDVLTAEIPLSSSFGVVAGCATVHAMLGPGGAAPWRPAADGYPEAIRSDIVAAARHSSAG